MKEFIIRWATEKVKKHGLRMGIFVITWFVVGHFIIPPLLVSLGLWKISWITYTPLDELILFPMAYFILK